MLKMLYLCPIGKYVYALQQVLLQNIFLYSGQWNLLKQMYSVYKFLYFLNIALLLLLRIQYRKKTCFLHFCKMMMLYTTSFWKYIYYVLY